MFRTACYVNEFLRLICKNQGRKFLADTAHAIAVPSVGSVRVHTAAIEVQIVCDVRVVLCRRPIAPVRTGFVQRTGYRQR